MLTLRNLAIAGAFVVVGLLMARCTAKQRVKVEAQAALYNAACEGPPLGSPGKRSEAMDEGHLINQNFDCIDKAAFLKHKQQSAAHAAANSPEAKALRARERAAAVAADDRERSVREAENAVPFDPATTVPLRMVEANTASAAELEAVYGISPKLAGDIVHLRSYGPYASWPDLAERVFNRHIGKSAGEASIAGLTVNGQSMPGIPANAETVARARYNAKKRND